MRKEANPYFSPEAGELPVKQLEAGKFMKYWMVSSMFMAFGPLLIGGMAFMVLVSGTPSLDAPGPAVEVVAKRIWYFVMVLSIAAAGIGCLGVVLGVAMMLFSTGYQMMTGQDAIAFRDD